MAKPKGTLIEPGIVKRVAAGVRYAFSGRTPAEWFPPGEPIAPTAPPEVKGRAFDYDTGYNQQTTPRRDTTAGLTFNDLRTLADSYDLMRLVIETRKDQVEALDWVVRPRLPKGKKASGAHEKRAEAAAEFLHTPDRWNTWAQWLRMVVEEMLVTDAVAIYPAPTRGGGVYSLDLIDGATIKRVIDQTGRTPLPPDAAFQQVLKGMPAADFTREELIYFISNPRVNKLYGFSPVEQVITTVQLALKRQLTQLSYYTEGNVPESLVSVPKEWNTDQIKVFQTYWNTMMQGDNAARQKMKFVPADFKYQPTRETVVKDVFDEWLARVVCFAFSISPTPFVSQVNRAVAEASLKQAASEGLLPLMNRVKAVLDICLSRIGFADCEFFWEDDEDEKPLESAQVHATYVNARILTPDEVREELNRPPLPDGMGQMKPPPTMGAPDKEGETKPGEEDPADDEEPEPVAKAAKRPLVVSNTRPAVKKATARLAKTVRALLSAKAAVAAVYVRDRWQAIAKEEDDRSRDFVGGMDFGTWHELQDAVADYAAEIFEDAGRQAVVRLGARIGEDEKREAFRVVHTDAVNFANERAAELVKDISDTTRDMLRSTVTEGIEQGWSSEELADRIREETAFSPERAETIARTELAEANSTGCRAGWEASGVVEGKEWLLGSDSCDICQGNADEGVIPFDKAFSSGHMGPTAHPNCTCDLAAVLAPE